MKMKWIWKNIFIYIIFIVCLIGLGISTYDIVIWKIDANKIQKQIEEIHEIINLEEIEKIENNQSSETIENEENIEIIEQEKEIPKFNPYWDYIKMNFINIDFNELKEMNSSTQGWIKVNGTNINYPFVQSKDNKYYLTHSFDKSYNSAGWVFLDYRNNINNLSKNTIIYAHGRRDTTMFGSLKNILNNEWLNDTNNFVIKLSTEKENTLWQVFSVYHIPTTNDYIQVDFNENEEFLKWAEKLINRSQHHFDTLINESDNILTLSTCYNDEEKMVVHAKLIKKEAR